MVSYTTASELFRGVSEKETAEIEKFCRERHFSKGAVIFSAGNPSDCIFIITSGLVKLITHSGRGEATILHILKEDSVFGELVFASEKRVMTAVAKTAVTATVVSRKDFFRILKSIPTVSMNFIRILSKRLMKVEKEFSHFSHTWSYQRLARVLVEIGREHGIDTPNGTVIPFNLTHEDLSNLIGTTRETVTHNIKKLKEMGFLETDGRKLIINKPRLEEYVSS